MNARAAGRMPSTAIKQMPVTALMIFGAIAAFTVSRWLSYGVASIYGVAVFTILGAKLLLSLLPARRWPAPDPRTRVGVVITVYNEDPQLLRRCLDSLLGQTFKPALIAIVDDCSTDPAAYELACTYASFSRRIRAFRQPRNMGKRAALARGFRAMAGSVDVYLCVDSDSVLEPNAIYEGLRPFRSRRVTAVTGIVLPLNYDTNLLTGLQDVRYANGFLGERAAYSRFGSVLCVCGAIAFWRANVVLRHLDTFLNQRFLGRPATVGDDRHLTNLCLTEGEVVLAEQCIAHTAVPEKLSHFVRQQARWGRSFFRESWWALTHHSPLQAAWWLTLLELAQWAVFSTILVYVVIIHPMMTGQFLILEYLSFIGMMALARSVRYFDVRRRGQSLRSRLATFAIAPLYGYMSLLVMLPLRFWSLSTLGTVRWGTRTNIEVALTPAPAPPLPRQRVVA